MHMVNANATSLHRARCTSRFGQNEHFVHTIYRLLFITASCCILPRPGKDMCQIEAAVLRYHSLPAG